MSSLLRREVHSRSVDVPLITIDSLDLAEVAFVKIDVDGHEVPALRGAADTARRDHPVLMVEAEHRIQPVDDILGLLDEWGYQPWVLPDRKWIPLAGFDLADHQRRAGPAADRGLPAWALWPHPRYVNLLLCLPAGRRPPHQI